MQQKKKWFLRKNDGSEYGPVSLDDLLRWSAQCRIIAGNAVSTDREEWIPVESLPDLQMDWVALRADGKEYGPFALDAVQELFDHKVLPADAILMNRRNGENKPLVDVISLPDTDTDSPAGEDTGEAVPEVESSPAIADHQDVADMLIQQERERSREPKSRKEPRPARHPVNRQQPELLIAASDPVTKAQVADDSSSPVPPGEDELPLDEVPHSEDLDRVQQNLQDCMLLRQQESDRFNNESQALHQQIESLQCQLLTTQKEATAQSSLNADQYKTLLAELDHERAEAQKAGIRLEALETERSHAVQETDADLADLRKQTAFMKKNIAVLHAEIEAARRQAQRRGTALLVLGAFLTLTAAILFMRALGGGCRRAGHDVAATAHPAAGQTVSDVQQQSGRRPTASEPRTASATAQPSWPSLQVKGLRVISENKRLLIRFDEGAFSSLTTLTPDATTRLKALADQLRPQMDRYRLVVEGHSDDTPMRPTAAFADNQALAAARGETVVAFLQRDGALPAANVTSATTPGAAPYPNDSPENRRRNRTVQLLLIPRTP